MRTFVSRRTRMVPSPMSACPNGADHVFVRQAIEPLPPSQQTGPEVEFHVLRIRAFGNGLHEAQDACLLPSRQAAQTLQQLPFDRRHSPLVPDGPGLIQPRLRLPQSPRTRADPNALKGRSPSREAVRARTSRNYARRAARRLARRSQSGPSVIAATYRTPQYPWKETSVIETSSRISPRTRSEA